MGWRDRDYALFTDDERKAYYGTGSAAPAPRSAGHGIGIRRGAGVAIAASAAIFALGHYPPGHPLVPQLELSVPIPARPKVQPVHRHLQLTLPTTAALGSGVTISGDVPGYARRTVMLESSANGDPWRLLSTAQTDAGGLFQTQITYSERGTIRLRLTYPNGDTAVGTVTVP